MGIARWRRRSSSATTAAIRPPSTARGCPAYTELLDGAEIRYTTSDLALVSAIHAWFAAQLSHHGGHAMDHGGQ